MKCLQKSDQHTPLVTRCLEVTLKAMQRSLNMNSTDITVTKSKKDIGVKVTTCLHSLSDRQNFNRIALKACARLLQINVDIGVCDV